MIPKLPLFRKLDPLEPYLVPAIILVVGLGAFGLGRLSAAPGHEAVRILYPDARAAQPQAPMAAAAAAAPEAPAGPGSGAYVASKSGTKYYLATCSGAQRIKPENRIYFGSKDEAAAAGYGPAATCPGL